MSNDLNELELILRLGETLKTAADAIKGLAVMQSELSAQLVDLQFKFERPGRRRVFFLCRAGLSETCHR